MKKFIIQRTRFKPTRNFDWEDVEEQDDENRAFERLDLCRAYSNGYYEYRLIEIQMKVIDETERLYK